MNFSYEFCQSSVDVLDVNFSWEDDFRIFIDDIIYRCFCDIGDGFYIFNEGQLICSEMELICFIINEAMYCKVDMVGYWMIN